MRSILFCVAVAMAAGCNAPPTAVDEPDVVVPDPKPEVRVASIRFAPSVDAVVAEQFTTDFQLLAQRDIIAMVDLEDKSGVHFLRFEVLNGGVDFRTTWIAFSSDVGAPESANHPVLGEAMPVRKLNAADGWVTLQKNIPVAGTSFTRYRLQGEFEAKVYVGMGDDPALATSMFTMSL